MNFFDSLMSPLSKDHCMFFYYLGLLSLLLALFALGGLLMGTFKKKSGYAMGAYFMSFLSNILMYYTLRIYYSICIVSLR
jgi:hypothetical protein